MSRATFYHATTKKIIVAFATIFDEVVIKDDWGNDLKVPLVFAQKEKFIDDIQKGVEYDMDGPTQAIVFPRMGFEIVGLNFAPERHLNPMQQLLDTQEDGQDVLMYNRIPYDITFDLFIGCKQLEHGLKVMEQVVPFFNPELTVTIKDKEEFKLETNIPITLNSVALNIDYQGSLDTSRIILFSLNFTAKAYYYPDIRNTSRIKQTILNFREQDFDRQFERFTSTVSPITADKYDDHVIIDTREIIG